MLDVGCWQCKSIAVEAVILSESEARPYRTSFIFLKRDHPVRSGGDPVPMKSPQQDQNPLYEREKTHLIARPVNSRNLAFRYL